MGVFLRAKHYNKDFDMGYMSFAVLRNKIANYVSEIPSSGTIKFLEQSDCSGKLASKECRELYTDIIDMPDDGTKYGYYGCQRTLTEFKGLLRHCFNNRCNLYWS